MERKTCSEVTKCKVAYTGEEIYEMVTWEWRNGWNLVSARRATPEEIADYLSKRSMDETSHYRGN